MYKTGLSTLVIQELNAKGFVSKTDAIKPFQVTRGCKVFEGNYVNIDTLPAVGTFGEQGFVSIRDYIDAKVGNGGGQVANAVETQQIKAIYTGVNLFPDKDMWEYPVFISFNWDTKEVSLNITRADGTIEGHTLNSYYSNVTGDLSTYTLTIDVYVDGIYLGTAPNTNNLNDPQAIDFYLSYVDANDNLIDHNLYLLENGIGITGQTVTLNINKKRSI